MPNTFLSLDIPPADGAGAPLITRMTGTPKTFVCSGAPQGGRYIVEGSNDAGATWDILTGRDGTEVLFASRNAGAKTVDTVVDRVRVRSVGNRSTGERPTVALGAPPARGLNVFGALEVPASNGLGAPFDLGLSAGALKTFSLRGSISPGSRYSVLASIDGVRFDQVMLFTGDRQGLRSVEALCRYLRVERAGAGPRPVVTVGSEGLLEVTGGNPLGANAELTIDDAAVRGTTADGEEVLFEYRVPLSSLGSPEIVPELSGAFGYDGAAGGRFRLRLGGTPGAADGAEIVRLDIVPPDAPMSARGAPFAAPSEPATLVKVTGHGPNAMVGGVVITFRSAQSQ